MLTGDTPYVSSKRQATKSTLLDEITMANRPSVAAIDQGERHDPSITFDVIAWLREQSGLPVIVKGVLRGDDARRCLEAGASAVVVSNHGGRQLDGAVATARALPEVVASVGDDGEVYVDGGIRSGVDVLRALALGARAVLIGRPSCGAWPPAAPTGSRPCSRACATNCTKRPRWPAPRQSPRSPTTCSRTR